MTFPFRIVFRAVRILRVAPTLKSCSFFSTTPRCQYQSLLSARFYKPYVCSAAGFRYINDSSDKDTKVPPEPPEKLGLVARFKQMYRDYWYVLLPVHIATSTIWFGSFYFIAKGGVDIVQLLTYIGLSESYTESLKNSSAGYFALAYAMYKLSTPLRYTVTIGGTTITINYLKDRGYIKPIPSRDKLKEMYTDKKQEFVDKRNQMRERKDDIKENLKQKIRKIKDG